MGTATVRQLARTTDRVSDASPARCGSATDLQGLLALQVVEGSPADRDRQPEGERPEEQYRADRCGSRQPGSGEPGGQGGLHPAQAAGRGGSEEHTSELQS